MSYITKTWCLVEPCITPFYINYKLVDVLQSINTSFYMKQNPTRFNKFHELIIHHIIEVPIKYIYLDIAMSNWFTITN